MGDGDGEREVIYYFTIHPEFLYFVVWGLSLRGARALLGRPGISRVP